MIYSCHIFCYTYSKLVSNANACGIPISYFQDHNDINYNIGTFIKSQLSTLTDNEILTIKEAIKNDPSIKLDHILDCSKTFSSNLFKTPKENTYCLLNQPFIIDFCEVDINKLNEEEAEEFIDELLRQLRLISYKYKR